MDRFTQILIFINGAGHYSHCLVHTCFFFQLGKSAKLPSCPIQIQLSPLRNDIHIKINISRINSLRSKTFFGERNEFMLNQIGYRNFFIFKPCKFRIHPEARCFLKIISYIFPAHLFSNIPPFFSATHDGP